MPRFFNTAGPCKPEIHYMVPTAGRIPEVPGLVDGQNYFVLHAPRQVGKTTSLMQFAQRVTLEGSYAAVLVSCEVGAAFPDDVAAAEDAMLHSWRYRAEDFLPRELWPPPWPAAMPPGQRVRGALRAWVHACPRPLVVFLDEIDALGDQVLLSVLRQLRDGHASRPQGFPWSLALVGLRDVRDYKIASGGSLRLNTSSPFNIKARSLTMGSFSQDDIASLYQQHTQETGQRFESEAIELAYTLTKGQPWLVNALAQVCVQTVTLDRTQPITPAHVMQAKEILVQRQDTHLDSLLERLRDARVHAIIEPILTGEYPPTLPDDDVRYVLDLGLLVASQGGGFQVANPIYQEVIPRALASTTQITMPAITPSWLTPDGLLNAPQLLEAFVDFWRQHGQPLMQAAAYPEAAPHLVLLAFLQRVVNGGGHIEREYAVGSGRMDLLVTYGTQRLALELKVWRLGKKDPKESGLTQLDRYLAGVGLQEGWLVIFDQRPGLPPLEERTTVELAETPTGKKISVVRA